MRDSNEFLEKQLSLKVGDDLRMTLKVKEKLVLKVTNPINVQFVYF